MVSPSLPYFAFALACSTLAFVLVLGWHEGNYMAYRYQLMAPPFFLWLFQGLRSPKRLHRWRHASGIALGRHDAARLALISMPLLLINALILSRLLLNPVFLRQKDSSEWAELYRYVDGSRRILNSPVIVSEMIKLGMQPLNSGQSEFYYQIKPYPEIGLLGPTYRDLRRRGVEYSTSILAALRKREFDRIIITETGQQILLYEDIIHQYYSKVTTITVDMPQSGEQWRIEIWEPNR